VRSLKRTGNRKRQDLSEMILTYIWLATGSQLRPASAQCSLGYSCSWCYPVKSNDRYAKILAC
jgi:hypothetical protein